MVLTGIQKRHVRLALIFMLLTGTFIVAAAPQRTDKPPRPNIIFILADDLGYGDLGCYGQQRIKTPNLDKMATEGIRFTQAYSGSTVCAPSRCSLMTGLHTGHALIRGNGKVPLRQQDRTIAETLQRAGWYTALIGKWGLGSEQTTGMPHKKGFTEFLGYLDQTHAHDYYTEYLYRFDPGTGYDGKIDFEENASGRKALYTHDLFMEATLNFLSIRKPTQYNGLKPFFLYLALTIPHANNEEGKRSGNGMQVPSTEPYSSESWLAPEKGKAAMITRMDAHIGKVFEQLKELGIDDNTLVIFSSDNGPHKEGGVDPAFFRSAGPFRGHKRDLYEGGIRVPLIARWPARIKPAQVSDLPCAFWDMPATLAEVASITNAPAGDGISIAPTLLGQAQTNRHEFLYWEFHERGFNQALRMGDWKAIKLEDKPIALYDLKTDPGETADKFKDNPGIVKKAQEYLAAARTDSENWPVKKSPVSGKKRAAKKQ